MKKATPPSQPESLKLLEADWDALLADKKWSDLGKCMRALVKVHKNACQLSQMQYDIEKRIQILEKNLNAVDHKTRFSIVGDILYARRAIRSSATAEYGAAFQGKRGGLLGTGGKT